MILFKDLSFSYMKEPILKNINVTIKPGECILLCGKSGCGKTTFTRILNGLIPTFYSGNLQGFSKVFDLESTSHPIEDYVSVVGSVFQNPKTQYFNMDTTSELAFPCENIGMPPEQIRQRVFARAKEFNISHLLHQNIFHLSGGQKQSIAFVCANMLDPKLLVLDEPTSNLDEDSIQVLHDFISHIKKKGITIVIAEHRIAWVKDLVDRFLYFDNGEITHDWSLLQIQNYSTNQLSDFGLRSLDMIPFKQRIKEKKKDSNAEILLSTNNLIIGYDQKNPIRTIDSFALYKKEIACLMGKNGVGKTTLIKTICGLIPPLSGTIHFENKPMKKNNLLNHCFLVMQDVNYQLFSDSVKDEILLGVSNTENYQKIIEALDLTTLENRHPMSLSGGQKQRVAIACAMMSNKPIIIMDEPTSGLDYYHMMKFGQLIQDLKEAGRSVLIITHDEELAANWSDRIIYLKKEEK